MSDLCRGTVDKKLRWAFHIYDVDGDGAISRTELEEVVLSIHQLMGEVNADPVVATANSRLWAERIFKVLLFRKEESFHSSLWMVIEIELFNTENGPERRRLHQFWRVFNRLPSRWWDTPIPHNICGRLLIFYIKNSLSSNYQWQRPKKKHINEQFRILRWHFPLKDAKVERIFESLFSFSSPYFAVCVYYSYWSFSVTMCPW